MRTNWCKLILACSDLEMMRKREEGGCYTQSEGAGDPGDFTADNQPNRVATESDR